MFTRFASRVARPAASAWKASGGVATVAAKSAHNYRLVAGAGLAALAAAAGTLSEDNKAACSNTVFGAVRELSERVSALEAANGAESAATLDERLTAIEATLGVGQAVFSKELEQIAAIKKAYPNNIAIQLFDEEYFASLGLPLQKRLIQIIRTGIANPQSENGFYAMKPEDYEVFHEYLDKCIRKYHRADPSAVHETDWDASAVGDNGVLDVTKLGLGTLSMRVRVGRNLAAFNLPGSMDRAERIRFEKTMLKAFAALQAMPEYGGNVYSLSPDLGDEANPNLISEEKYQELVKAHVMFKDMSADPYLEAAGIASDWPYGRGCWRSADGQCIIWFGEEDQLRIMCMKKGTKLNEVFDRLKKMLDVVESIDGIKFARSDKYGYITSCPSNLGTGMRASVHIKIPNLTSDGTDSKAKAVCKPLGLSVRGVGGEHTPIGADGTVDISPSARLFIRERDIIAALYQGISNLMAEENKA